MGLSENKFNFEFDFECERCGNIWQETILEHIDQCTPEELSYIHKYIQEKFKT